MASKWVGLKLVRGERVRLETPGGGGYGPAAKRAPAAIANDIDNGYVTSDAAAIASRAAPIESALIRLVIQSLPVKWTSKTEGRTTID